jgi:hypothetical protein
MRAALHQTALYHGSALVTAVLFLYYHYYCTSGTRARLLRGSYATSCRPWHISCMLLSVVSGPFTARGSASEMRGASRARRVYTVRWHMDRHGLSAVCTFTSSTSTYSYSTRCHGGMAVLAETNSSRPEKNHSELPSPHQCDDCEFAAHVSLGNPRCF